jgi:hypothetical protein
MAKKSNNPDGEVNQIDGKTWRGKEEEDGETYVTVNCLA